jgi:hypothetical protein
MASPTTSPFQLISGTSPWYPKPDPALSAQTNLAIRRAFDDIYQLVNSLSLGVQATGSGKIVVPAAPAPPALVTGCQLSLPRAGLWIVIGCVTFQIQDAGDIGSVFSLLLGAQGQQQAGPATGVSSPNMLVPQGQLEAQAQPVIQTIAQNWSFRANQGASARLLVQKDSAGTGTTSQVLGANSAISAIWAGL